MSKNHSITPQKPTKPFADFPLFAHQNGSWAKKIRGRLFYFGPWSDPDAALEKYLKEKHYLHSGRKPRPNNDELTVKELCNAFLIAKRELLDLGEITGRTWDDYKEMCDLLVENFGKGRIVADLLPDDFAELRNKMTKKWNATTLGNRIQRIRVIFNYAVANALIGKAIPYGQGFRRPSKKTVRLERAKKGPRMFEAEELRKIIDAASFPLKAMILLGVNCGFGNADCGTLPLSAVNLDRGWLDYHRPKTGISRRCPLWPETNGAIQKSLEVRPEPKDAVHAGLVFITKYGDSWHKDTSDSPISKEMRKLLDSLEMNGNRNFYALRHTFETIGGEVKDQVTVDAIMGHARDDMASVYRERISDERLQAVVDYVRGWLYPEK